MTPYNKTTCTNSLLKFLGLRGDERYMCSQGCEHEVRQYVEQMFERLIEEVIDQTLFAVEERVDEMLLKRKQEQNGKAIIR